LQEDGISQLYLASYRPLIIFIPAKEKRLAHPLTPCPHIFFERGAIAYYLKNIPLFYI
jgi:hypothetical protein